VSMTSTTPVALNAGASANGTFATTSVLIAATVFTGLAAGVIGLYAHTIMPGLKKTDDRTFVGAFQAMDRAIYNPWFMATFFGALILIAVATVQHLGTGRRAALPWLGVALVLYLITVIVTMVVNVPLNDAPGGRRRSRPHRRRSGPGGIQRGPVGSVELRSRPRVDGCVRHSHRRPGRHETNLTSRSGRRVAPTPATTDTIPARNSSDPRQREHAARSVLTLLRGRRLRACAGARNCPTSAASRSRWPLRQRRPR
jgi:uncharacterized membrane protein